MLSEPDPDNDYLLPHAALLIRSYRVLTGNDLVAVGLSARAAAEALYHAPFVLLSHDNAPDPRFTYANLAAQSRFEMPWRELVGMPSRYSAEPIAREARALLLAQVAQRGYVDDYRGIRIARSGRRFLIEQATVWNLSGPDGGLQGQAAMFSRWTDLADAEHPGSRS